MYISAKAALEAYARVLALELAPRGTRVNCIAPAFVRTPMLNETAENFSQEAVDKIEARQLMGLGDPVDVANTIVFYLSEASKWVIRPTPLLLASRFCHTVWLVLPTAQTSPRPVTTTLFANLVRPLSCVAAGGWKARHQRRDAAWPHRIKGKVTLQGRDHPFSAPLPRFLAIEWCFLP